MTQLPTPSRVSAPLVDSTVHTVNGVAKYDTVVSTPPGAVTVGAADPNATEDALYWNPVSVWSPLATAGNVIGTSAVLPTASLTVTVTSAVFASAASGVPPIAPVPVSRFNPDGSPVALYSSMPMPPEGFMTAIASPTFSVPGAVYVGAVGAVRSTVSVRVIAAGAVKPVFRGVDLHIQACARDVGRVRCHAYRPGCRIRVG